MSTTIESIGFGGTKHFIEVHHETAFNGAVADTPRGKLCLFRTGDAAHLMYTWLDSNLVSHESILLPFVDHDDPRIITHEGRIFLSTSHHWNFWTQGHIELQEVVVADDGSISFRDVARFETIQDWPGYKRRGHEKNWAPFSHDGIFYYVYSLKPHRILAVDLETGTARLAFKTEYSSSLWPIPDDNFGHRLSAPPVLLSDGTYLSTFHTICRGDYYTGFYRFAGEPPFEVLSMSCQPAIWPKDVTREIWRQTGKNKVIFIQGMSIYGEEILLIGGEADDRVVAIRMSLAATLENLKPVDYRAWSRTRHFRSCARLGRELSRR